MQCHVLINVALDDSSGSANAVADAITFLHDCNHHLRHSETHYSFPQRPATQVFLPADVLASPIYIVISCAYNDGHPVILSKLLQQQWVLTSVLVLTDNHDLLGWGYQQQASSHCCVHHKHLLSWCKLGVVFVFVSVIFTVNDSPMYTSVSETMLMNTMLPLNVIL